MSSFQIEPSPEDIVRVLLKKTGQTGPPTDAIAIVEYLGLKIKYFDNHSKDGLDKKIKAYLWPARREIGIYSELTSVQQRFSIFHEIGHFVLPGHVNTLESLENEDRITDDIANLGSIIHNEKNVSTREIEANQFAADCLFQLENFTQFSQTAELNWKNIIVAADDYQASIEATARRWIEESREAIALVVFSPVKRKEILSPLEVLYTITSPSFASRYFSGLQKGQRMSADSAIYKLYYRLGNFEYEAEEILYVKMSEDLVEEFRMQLFNNSYRVLGILTPVEDE